MKQLWTYIIIAYSITWTFVIGIYFLYTQNAISLNQLNIYFTFGSLGPFISAIITTKLFYKRDGLKKLFATLHPNRLNKKTLLLSCSPLLLFLIGWLLYPLFTGKWFSFAVTKEQFSLTDLVSYLGWALPFIAYALFEELGWRGFALPHLQSKYSAFQSTVILTFIWALWHAPFFLWRFNFSIGISIGFFFGIFVGAIILTSIFNLSRGCVLAAIIFHLTNNIASAFDKNYIVAVVSTGFVLLAIYLLIKYKPKNLSDGERVKITGNIKSTPTIRKS
ncbi:MAG: type II CAAX prenyl endopeptidase Rce1 family protein [Chitinophagaceae bacterium]